MAIDPSELNRSPDLIDPDTAALGEITDDRFKDHPRRVLQIMDRKTALWRLDWYRDEYEVKYGPLTSIKIDELWQDFGQETEFGGTSWEYFEQHFGTAEMHADPAHQEALHGDDHLARVLLYAYILGKYKGISPSEMKVLLTAASVHDRARTDDRDAPNHGRDAAWNFNHDMVYEVVDENGVHKHTVPAYIGMYKKRSITFEDPEVRQVEQLCEYHEVPWEKVPQELDDRTRLLIQILQIADAADRFRSPSTRWWPKPEFMQHFFQDEEGQLLEKELKAFLHFTASFTLLSEERRFGNIDKRPALEVIREYAQEVGIATVTQEDVEDEMETRRRVGV